MSLRFVVACVTLATSVQVAVAIKCLGCTAYSDEAGCESQGTNITCYERLSSDTFQTLKQSKGSLEEPRRNTGYQCAEIHIAEKQPFIKGCIYANLDICKEFPEAIYCRTCKEDLCNTIQYKNSGRRVGASTGVLMVMAVVSVFLVACVARF